MKRTAPNCSFTVRRCNQFLLGLLAGLAFLTQTVEAQQGANQPYWQQVPMVAANDPGWASASDDSKPLPPSRSAGDSILPPSNVQGLPNSAYPPSPFQYPTTPELPPVRQEYRQPRSIPRQAELPRPKPQLPLADPRPQVEQATLPASRQPTEVTVPIPTETETTEELPSSQPEVVAPHTPEPSRVTERTAAKPNTIEKPAQQAFFLPGSTRTFTGLSDASVQTSVPGQPPMVEQEISQTTSTEPDPFSISKEESEDTQPVSNEPSISVPLIVQQQDVAKPKNITPTPPVETPAPQTTVIEDRYADDRYANAEPTGSEFLMSGSVPNVVENAGMDDYYRERYAKDEPATPPEQQLEMMAVNVPRQQEYQPQPPTTFQEPIPPPVNTEPAPVARLRMEVGPRGQLPAQAKLNTGPAELVGAAVLARVGTEVILASEVIPPVEARLEQAKGSIPPSQLQKIREGLIKKQLQRIIERKILYIEAKRDIPAEAMEDVRSQLNEAFQEYLTAIIADNKLSGVAELEAKFEEQGLTMANQKRQFQETTLARQWMRKNTEVNETVTRDELLDYYNEHKEEYKLTAKARWQELMVDSTKIPNEEQAFDTLVSMGNRILDGEPFEQVAKRSSHGVTAENGGVRDWTEKGALVCQEMDNALFSLPPMTLSPIIRSKQGFHILMVLEREDAGYTDFIEKQPEIREIILEERRKEAQQKYLDKVRDSVQVWTIFDEPSQDRIARP